MRYLLVFFMLIGSLYPLLARGETDLELCDYLLANKKELQLKPLGKSTVFQADINGDGVDEIFFMTHSGSGRYVDLVVRELRYKDKTLKQFEAKDCDYEYGRSGQCELEDDFLASNAAYGFGGSYVDFIPLKYKDKIYFINDAKKYFYSGIYCLDKGFHPRKICGVMPIFIPEIKNAKNQKFCQAVLDDEIGYLPNYKSSYEEKDYAAPEKRYDEIRAYYRDVDFFNDGNKVDFIEYAQNPGYSSQCPVSFFNLPEANKLVETCTTGIRLAKREGKIYVIVKDWDYMGQSAPQAVYLFEGREPELICRFKRNVKYRAI